MESPDGEAKYVGKCLLEVKNVPKLFGSCNVTEGADGGMTLGMDERKVTYFATVMASGNGEADGYWNGTKGAGHAHDSLGTLKRKGRCWENANARVCAWQ